MSLLVALVIGLGIGVASGFLLPENIEHLLLDVMMGISGSIIGLVFYVLFLRPPTASNQGTPPLFDLRAALASAIGALLLILAFNGIHKLSSKNAAHVGDVEDSEVDLDKLDD